jgi:hypothetical protein
MELCRDREPSRADGTRRQAATLRREQELQHRRRNIVRHVDVDVGDGVLGSTN